VRNLLASNFKLQGNPKLQMLSPDKTFGFACGLKFEDSLKLDA
jgi:hypothetical protein